MVPQEKKEELLADLVCPSHCIFIKHMFSLQDKSCCKEIYNFSHMQVDRKIQHSLHINNVQELIEKEKVLLHKTDIFEPGNYSPFRSRQHLKGGK